MEKQGILNMLAGTLDPNPQQRNVAEKRLAEIETQPGFTQYILGLCVDPEVALAQRISAAVFFKNRLNAHWRDSDTTQIPIAEKEEVKNKLLEALVKTHADNHLRPQLQLALKTILDRSQWDLTQPIMQLLSSKDDQAHVYTGLLLLLEAVRALRYKYVSSERVGLEGYISTTFPLLESLSAEIVLKDDYFSGEILYYILKIFKYATLAALPQYFHDINRLSAWISLHLTVVQKPTPEELLQLDPADRVLDKRIKANKWGYGNLQKFYQKFCSPTSKDSSPEFIEFFNKNYLPTILGVYFTTIEKWGSGTWVSDPSLFNLISLLERCTISESWGLIQPHYNSILRHLIFPCLTQEDLELFEDDAEEYVRRFFDINRESNTSDIAAVDLLFVTAHHRPEQIPEILGFLNEVFGTYAQDDSLPNALKAEGGLRILSSISFALTKTGSPFESQVDQILDGFVVPHIKSKYLFLRARACEVVSIFTHEYNDKGVLSRIMDGVYENFKNDDCLPVQIEAADAMKVLISDTLVSDAIRKDVPHIMEKLLNLSRTYDLDLVTEVMESLLEVFADELQPFATQLGQSLCEQFIQSATESLELAHSGNAALASDKEYQAVGFINTMTTMVISMVKVDFESIFTPAAKFVISNAAINFLAEAMEMVESMTMNKKTITPVIWDLYRDILDSFQTYAVEFFENYVPFLENIIIYGFKGMNSSSDEVKSMNQLAKEIIESEIDYDDQGAFELVEYMTLTLGEFNENLPLILDLFKKDDHAPYNVIKTLLASLYADPTKTLQLTESQNDTIRLLEIWYNLSANFENVYGLKLQCLALLSLLSLPEIPQTLVGFIPQLSNKLALSIERLPDAMKRRQEQLTSESSPEVFTEDYVDVDDDSFKDTPLDSINIFIEFKNKLTNIQHSLPERYQHIIGSLTPEKLAVVQNVIQYVEQNVPN